MMGVVMMRVSAGGSRMLHAAHFFPTRFIQPFTFYRRVPYSVFLQFFPNFRLDFAIPVISYNMQGRAMIVTV